MKLVIESPSGTLNLNGVADVGYGFQAKSGVQGLGLVKKVSQWLEGAGDGALYRGRRIGSRKIDIPLHVLALDHEHLESLVSRLTIALDQEMTLKAVEDNGTYWSLKVRDDGSGDWLYGVDTCGGRELDTSLSLRAGDSYWVYSEPEVRSITNAGAGRSLLSLAQLRVSASQAIGTMRLDNSLGDAPADPVWTVIGPGKDLKCYRSDGVGFWWAGTLAAGETLVIDTAKSSVIDGHDANRYADFAAAPRLWAIPPGLSQATVSLEDTTVASSITCAWRPKRWAIV